MTSAPFSFRWTNFFRALEAPTGKRAFLLLTGLSDLPLPTSQQNIFPGLFWGTSEVDVMATNLPPRSCSWQVIIPCLLKVFTFQSSRGIGRNAGTVLAYMVPYPQPPWAGKTAELGSRGKNMHFHHWQRSSKNSVRSSEAENRIQHPCFSHRNTSHFKIGETNTSGYSGKGLQSWGRERKRHAGQSRMCSWCCRCGHGKEKENGGSFCRGYRLSKLKVARLVCSIPIRARQNCPLGSLKQLLQDPRRNGIALHMDTSTCLVPLYGNIWTLGMWAIHAQLLPAPGPKRREEKESDDFPVPSISCSWIPRRAWHGSALLYCMANCPGKGNLHGWKG